VYRNLDDDREDVRTQPLADPSQLFDRGKPGVGGLALAGAPAMLVDVDPVESPAPELTLVRRLEKPTKPIDSPPFLCGDRVLPQQLVNWRARPPVGSEGPAVDLWRLDFRAVLTAPSGGGARGGGRRGDEAGVGGDGGAGGGAASKKAVVEPNLRKPESSLPASST
jgi:hypothetical protein